MVAAQSLAIDLQHQEKSILNKIDPDNIVYIPHLDSRLQQASKKYSDSLQDLEKLLNQKLDKLREDLLEKIHKSMSDPERDNERDLKLETSLQRLKE